MRGFMKKLVDYFVPDNCKVRLQKAAEQNAAACNSAVCLLEEHKNKFLSKIVSPAVKSSSNLRPFSAR